MIYHRPNSIETSNLDYELYFGSILNANAQCFNVGSGTWEHPAWTNIDLPAQSEAFASIQAAHIAHDLISDEDLPIQPSTAALIYTSHVIEHLPDVHVVKFFKSAYKALRTNGLFRIVTGPDANTDWAALIRGDSKWWYFYEGLYTNSGISNNTPLTLTDMWLLHFASPRSIFSSTPCDDKYTAIQLTKLFNKHDYNPIVIRDKLTDGLTFNSSYPGDHLSWWNADKLIRCLHLAGFSVHTKCAYGQSISPFMRDLNFFDTTYPHISLYVEAIK